MIFLQLFYEFFKAGLFAIGGGLATLPFLYDISNSTGWFTHGQLADMIAISESTPGAIGINMATYVGYTTAGLPGAVVATLGLVAPSIIIIIIIARFLGAFSENKLVKGAFYGLRPASVGLIAAAGFSVFKLALLQEDLFKVTGAVADLFNWKAIVLAVLIYIAMKKFNPHPVFAIAASAVVGVVFRFGGV